MSDKADRTVTTQGITSDISYRSNRLAKITEISENKRRHRNVMTLKELKVGNNAVIKSVGGEGALRQHFLDMGMIPGAEVTVVKLAPMGDPMELQIHGYELTLRLSEAAQIEIEEIKERSQKHKRIEKVKDSEHPGLGEKAEIIPKKMKIRCRKAQN